MELKPKPPREMTLVQAGTHSAAIQAWMDVLQRYGVPVIWRRTDHRIRCTCWHPWRGISARCPTCMGQGWVSEHLLTRVVPRHQLGSDVAQWHVLEPATLNPSKFVFYFANGLRPNSLDQVILTAFDEWQVPRLDHHAELYVIESVTAHFGEQGEVVYYRATARQDQVDEALKFFYFRHGLYYPVYQLKGV